MSENDFSEVCIVDKRDLIQYCCTTQLEDLDDIVRSVNSLYSIKKKSIYVINVASQKYGRCWDYYFNGIEGLWFLYNGVSYNGKENFLSAYKASVLVSKCLNAADLQKDALIIARASANQSAEDASFLDERYFPIITLNKDYYFDKNFHPMLDPVGFYQIVPDLFWLKYVINLGVKVVQLRIKNEPIEEVEYKIKEGVHIANQNGVKLFVNDYWQFAVKYKAYGVHLGQEDLRSANFNEIYNAGLRLGISTHCYHELAIAKYIRPSYIAFGPIFPTTLKNMNFMPQGTDLLNYWVKNLPYKIVAIGGINLSNVDSVIGTGVDGIAVISAVLNSEYPDKVVHEFIQKCQI
ncbi:thiamine-phosphate pyrophosphorylase [Ehrlichia chaffeensis str. Heartland]|uniref:thiamine phosphate synthase n=1 Tax=Ehrlichia chaffeensis TaxID=945 RepID=UPI000053CC5B|nr:thiamine phosphate synthase [Ehrlichia chaffeensis]AHX03935.1 thiamine-phosphate pyrophosphorylase [Ehrlichia chaffeensis str. Heartland]AHX08090.1 thiamine-phosphate pyrophosphorylase [Ehrlichia chaffeensis str. Saint Vincent]AHX10801.1 thiamine-phosphate pyrophosphorylase [Ehrlichia chaffeensis str. West Paces]